jgi:hypothetical protein
LISSCCGTKRIAEKNTNQDSKEIAQVEVSETSETPEPVEDIEKVEVEIEEEVIEPKPDDVVEDTKEVTSEPEAFNHNVWNNLLQKHVSNQGNVNYKGFRTDKSKFNSYLKTLSENPPQESWSKDETLAYWMNVYNAFTIKLILDNYPTKSIKDIKGPWSHRFIKIGPKWYTLNDVEHRIIRKMNEPRIHFALVCAAVSCPRLYNKAFTADNLEEDLSLLTRGFLNDTSKNNIAENSIKLSKIFKWYGGDFKNNGNDLIDFLNQYTDINVSSNAKKSYMDYNWALNE